MQTQAATQSETMVEGEWRVKTPIENDYNYIINNNGERLPFMEKFMGTVVTDTLKKTAKSYNKKSKKSYLLRNFLSIIFL